MIFPFIPRVLISLPSRFLLSICSESNLINSNFLSCNFNFSATSKALKSSSSSSGNNSLDFKYASHVNPASDSNSKFKSFDSFNVF